MVSTVKSVPESVQSLLPEIRERREEIEAARQIPRDLIDRLAATGVFRLPMPRALGGQEGDPLEIMRMIETVSAADGSTGWCTMLGLGSGIVSGYMNEAGAREVFGDPDAPKALVAEPAGAAVREDGGVRVSGRWRFASGITHSEWAVVGCVIMEDGKPRMTPHGPEIVHVFMPVKDMQIHDTWHVSGLCGTGSHDVSCQDVFVPQQRILSLFHPDARPEPLYQMPVLANVAPHIATAALGIARAALDELRDLAPAKTPALSTARLADKPMTQVEVARAEGALAASRAFLYDSVGDIWQTVLAGREVAPRQQAMCRIASLQASETASRVSHTASTLAGGSSVYNTSSLQRHARDADVIRHHMTQSPQVWEDAGRVLFDLEPNAPLF